MKGRCQSPSMAPTQDDRDMSRDSTSRRRKFAAATAGEEQSAGGATTVPVAPVRLLQHPVAAYLSSLAPDSADTRRKRLRAVAELLGVAPEYEGQPPEEAFADGFHRLAFTEVEF